MAAVGQALGLIAARDTGEAPVANRLNVSLPETIVDAVDDLVGRGGREAFFVEAARDAIQRRRRGAAEVAGEDYVELSGDAALSVTA